VGTLEENPIEEDENRIKGPGVYDMKSGLLQVIYALRALGVYKVDLPAAPLVFINSDEEIGSPESTRYIQRFSRCADRVFVMEPSLGREGKIKTERKGIGHFVVRIEGKAAHAGIEPEKGSNAIVELSRLVQELNEMNEPEKGLTVNVGKIEGGMRTNVVAPESKCEVDVRVPTKDLSRDIEEKIRSLETSGENFQITVEGGFRRPPMEFTDANRKLWDQVKQSGKQLGLELDHASTGGASDGNTASQFAPTIDGMGAVGDGAHEKFEFIYKDKLLERTALLALSLANPIPSSNGG
jgi:glutamate carboxypeptidase